MSSTEKLAESPTVVRVWKPNLYQLQQESPPPQPVVCPHHTDSDLARIYGAEFHGPISHAEASRLLTEDGMYLVRISGQANGQHATLSLRFAGSIKHYRLYQDAQDGTHYVKEKRFPSVRDLVADGLVTMFIEKEAGTYLETMYVQSTYEQSPYMTLNRLKIKTLTREAGAAKLLQQQEAASTNNNVGESKRESYDKAHAFRVHTFKGLNWCEYCGNFLWGFTAQGVKCEDCGFSAHCKCSERVPSDCCPDLRNLRGVFGTDLTTLTKAHRSARPFVLERCIEEIERRGLAQAEGLYRVPGFSDHVENLKLALDRDGEHTKMGPEVYDNVNVIAGTLKLFLRLLPIPVISYEAHPLLCKAADIRSVDEKIAAMREALTLLPLAHYHTLKYLVQHLARVASFSESNKMPAHNLATVFAPTLMPAPDLVSLTFHGGMPGMAAEISILQAMIQHQEHIFH